MTLVAAIGYVVGILIFAIFVRWYRRKMINKNISKVETNRSQPRKGSQHD